jgi:ubiquinone/menaquinone biosynthesis C-methylase UbiE
VGNGLDIGFGGSPIVGNAICVDRPEGHGARPVIQDTHPTHIVGDCGGLGWFTDKSMDWVFSSHVLEDFEDTAGILKEWVRVIKPGGHLVLFLPDQKTYEDYCKAENSLPNQAHKHANFSMEYVKAMLPLDVTVVYEEWPYFGNPYSFALVVKRT